MPLTVLLLTACLSSPPPAAPAPGVTTGGLLASPTDDDGDGYTAEDDCDDADPSVHPGQAEACDGVDNNCNGLADEGHPDTDGDAIADCVDTEACDGVDNDGDGQVDEGFPDADGDGTCDAIDAEECDGVDNDGDGLADEGFDLDGDGAPPCGPLPDCDDADPRAHPGAAEHTDDRDNDCDGLIDEHRYAPGDLVVTELMVNPAAVSDPDGEWIEVANVSDGTRYLNGLTLSTADASHTIAAGGALPVAPGAVVVLSASGDPDANGGVWGGYAYGTLSLSNEGGSLTLSAADTVLDTVAWAAVAGGASWSLDPLGWSADRNDDSGWWCAATRAWAGRDAGSPGAANEGCPAFDHDGDGFTGEEGDCDDADAGVYPGAEEVWYDGTDGDCDGGSDYDSDGDGVDIDAGDCDDADPGARPGGEEVCDGVDNDCDGLTDNDPVDGALWFADDDGDGFGDPGQETWACGAPSGTAETGDDCDDTDADVHPDAAEVCDDAVDDDCDGAAQYCDEAGYPIGGDSYSWSARGYYRGNIYLADSDEELLRYAAYIEVPSSGCDLDFRVYSASSLSGTWSLEWSSTVTASGEGWVSSGGIELETEAGTYYSLGVGWPCAATYHAGYGSFTGDDGGIGGFAGSHYDNGYTSAAPASVGAGSFAYAQVVYVSE